MIGDSEIMQSTVVTGEGISYVLPNGEQLQGKKPAGASEIQAWCDFVREHVERVHAQARQRGEARPRESRKEAATVAVGSDPVEHVTVQIEYWEEALEESREALRLAKEAFEAAEESVEKWRKVKEVLSA